MLAKLIKMAKADPLVMAFIIDAVIKQARRVEASNPKRWPKNCIVTHEAWKATAIKIQNLQEA